MKRSAYIGSAGVAGGASGEALGQVKWFAASDLIPPGWEKCDGGGLSPKKNVDAIAAMKADAGIYRKVGASLFSYRSGNQSTYGALGRGYFNLRGHSYVPLHGYQNGSLLLSRYKIAETPSTGSEGHIQVPSYCRSFGYIPEDDQLLFHTTAGLYSANPNELSGNPTLLSVVTPAEAAGNIPANTIIKVGSKYLTGSDTALRRCDGAGSWGSWPLVNPPGMVFGITDLLSVDIGGVQTGVILTWNGDIWTTTDALTFTKLPLKIPGTISAGSYKQNMVRLVHDGVSTFWLLNQDGTPKVYKSTDLQTWVEVVGASPNSGGGLPYHINASDGVVAIGYNTGSGAKVMLAMSKDQGTTWEHLILGNDGAYSSFPMIGITVSGAGVTSWHWNDTYSYMAIFELAQRKPRYEPMKRSGETVTAYIKAF